VTHFCLLAVLLTACSGGEGDDAGTPGLDAGRRDAGPSGMDSGTDGGSDAGLDAGNDAGFDGGPDGGFDGGPPIMCGTLGDTCGPGGSSCDVGQVCIPDVCVPTPRPLCSSSGMCSSETPICMLCFGCTVAVCITAMEQACICANPTGAASYMCP
jgi:hypothetical protein